MPLFKSGADNIFFLDEGQGDTVVFVHGTPTNSSEYSQVISDLKGDYRCICMDHLGFGNSDKPESGDYSIESHTERLRGLLQHLKIQVFHLVVHDFGGAIGIPLIKDPNFKIESLTLMNTWYWPLIETEPQMKSQRILFSSGLFPFLYKYFNFSPRVLYKMAWGSYSTFSKERHRAYIGQFPMVKDRSGPLSFLKHLFSFDKSCWRDIDSLHKIKSLNTQIVWGSADKLISTKTLTHWRHLLPQAQVIELSNVGHFVAEEAPMELAKHLRSHFGEAKSQ